MLSYDMALDLTKYFDKEENYAPWYSLISSLGYISSMLEGRPGYPLYEVSRIAVVLSFFIPRALVCLVDGIVIVQCDVRSSKILVTITDLWSP